VQCNGREQSTVLAILSQEIRVGHLSKPTEYDVFSGLLAPRICVQDSTRELREVLELDERSWKPWL